MSLTSLTSLTISTNSTLQFSSYGFYRQISSSQLIKSQIRPEILGLQSNLVQWRRELHMKPELGFEEHITAEFIQQQTSRVEYIF